MSPHLEKALFHSVLAKIHPSHREGKPTAPWSTPNSPAVRWRLGASCPSNLSAFRRGSRRALCKQLAPNLSPPSLKNVTQKVWNNVSRPNFFQNTLEMLRSNWVLKKNIYIILYYIILCYIILYYIISYHIISYYIILYYIILYYIIYIISSKMLSNWTKNVSLKNIIRSKNDQNRV